MSRPTISMPMSAADINQSLAAKAQMAVQLQAMHEQLSLSKAERAVQYLSLERKHPETIEAAEDFLTAFFRHAKATVPASEDSEQEFPVLSTA